VIVSNPSGTSSSSRTPRFACPQCGSEKVWKPELAGKHGKCKCGAVIAVPREAPGAVKQQSAPASFEEAFEAAAAGAYDVADDPEPAAPSAAGKPFVPQPVLIEREEADGSVSTVGAVSRPMVHSERAMIPRRRGLKREEKSEGPPPINPLRDYILPGILIAAGIPLAFAAERYQGGDLAWKPMSMVTNTVLMNIFAGLALVIGGVFAASAMGGVAFDEPVLQIIYKLCGVALAPAALGQLALLYFGGVDGAENINGGIALTFVSLGCYFALFMLLFRLPMSDQFVCVMVIFIIRVGVAYLIHKLGGVKNMNGMEPL
jgi:hypothetical protein